MNCIVFRNNFHPFYTCLYIHHMYPQNDQDNRNMYFLNDRNNFDNGNIHNSKWYLKYGSNWQSIYVVASIFIVLKKNCTNVHLNKPFSFLTKLEHPIVEETDWKFASVLISSFGIECSELFLVGPFGSNSQFFLNVPLQSFALGDFSDVLDELGVGERSTSFNFYIALECFPHKVK